MYNQAITFHQSPSQILNIHNPWMAYQIDESVLYFGRWVESKLNERDKKGKPKHTIDSIFNNSTKASATALFEASDADVIDI